MRVYTFLEARRKLYSLLSKAVKDGEIHVRRRDVQTFIIKPEKGRGFPLAVGGVDLGITPREIVELVQEGRSGGFV